MTSHQRLEHRQHLSQSMLWSLQRNFFQRHGVDAWRKSIVPHYLTSNPSVARAYAQVVFGWLRDVTASGAITDSGQPVYVVEVGAGCGRFGYHFLRAFFALHRDSVLNDVPVKFLLTDFSQASVDGWRGHPQFRSWIDAGVLDFACFDAEHDQSLTLIEAGATVAAENLRNPMAVIANYFFDSLPQDAFYIEHGQVFESLVSLELPGPECDPGDPELLSRVAIHFEPVLTNRDHYDDPAFNEILRTYQQTLDATNLLFPIGALRCIRNLTRLANGDLMLISGDKGYHREADLLNRGAPKVAVHGSISMMVNYHAVGQYVLACKGRYLSLGRRHGSLDICVAVMGDRAGDSTETGQAYSSTIDHVGPDDLFALKKATERSHQGWTVPQLIAHLRLSAWDTKVFQDCFPVIVDQLDGMTDAARSDMYEVVQGVWEAYFSIGEQEDLPFALAIVCCGIGYYGEAIEFLEHSLRLHGPDPATLYNLSTCYYQLDKLDVAMRYLDQTLAADATFEPAREFRAEIEAAVERMA